MHTTFDHVEFNGQFMRLGGRVRPYFEILRNGTNGKTIQNMVSNDFGVFLPDHEIKSFLEKIFLNSALLIDVDETKNRFKIILNKSKAARDNETMVRMRVTLITEKLVYHISEKMKFLYTKWAVIFFFCLVAINISIYSAYDFPKSVKNISSVQLHEINLWIAIPALVLSFIFHEIGHSTASLVGGVRPGRIGFGIHWIYPVFFSDVTKVWLINSRQRIVVDVGGIYFQSILTAIIGIVIPFVDNRIEISLLVCFICNAIAILLSINPALRYDGYWIISDYLDSPNLAGLSRKALLSLLKGNKMTGDDIFEGNKLKYFVFLSYLIFSWMFFAVFLIFLYFSMKNSIHFMANELTNKELLLSTGNIFKKLMEIFIHCIPLLFFPYVASRLFNSIRSIVVDLFNEPKIKI